MSLQVNHFSVLLKCKRGIDYCTTFFRASVVTIPIDKPLMTQFRIGKLREIGFIPREILKPTLHIFEFPQPVFYFQVDKYAVINSREK
jgi:hypothetical protein